MTQKALIFDASSIISFTMNGLFDEIRKLKSIFKGKFLITNGVKREVIDNPIKIKRFKFEALKVKQLLEEKVFEMPSSIGINDEEILKRGQEMLKIANSTFVSDIKKIHLIDFGEASCLALSEMLNKKGIKNILIVDERTTRMLVEKPENLKNLLEKKLHVNIKIDEKNIKSFMGFKIIRSTELAYVLWKKGITKLKGIDILEGLLYALKFKGASISHDEIREITSLK